MLRNCKMIDVKLLRPMFAWHKPMKQRFASALLMDIPFCTSCRQNVHMDGFVPWLVRRSSFPDSLRMRICILRGPQRLSLSCRTHFFSSNVSHQTPLIRTPSAETGLFEQNWAGWRQREMEEHHCGIHCWTAYRMIIWPCKNCILHKAARVWLAACVSIEFITLPHLLTFISNFNKP